MVMCCDIKPHPELKVSVTVYTERESLISEIHDVPLNCLQVNSVTLLSLKLMVYGGRGLEHAM